MADNKDGDGHSKDGNSHSQHLWVLTMCNARHLTMGVSAGPVTLLSGTLVGVVALLLFSRCCRRRAASCSSCKEELDESLERCWQSQLCPQDR
jgi:hypothetical protein